MADEAQQPTQTPPAPTGDSDSAKKIAELEARAAKAEAKAAELKAQRDNLHRERAAEKFVASLNVKPESYPKAMKLMGAFKVKDDGTIDGADELAAEIKDTLAPTHFAGAAPHSDKGGDKPPERKPPAQSPGTPPQGDAPKAQPKTRAEALPRLVELATKKGLSFAAN